jgi:hypothetical protein
MFRASGVSIEELTDKGEGKDKGDKEDNWQLPMTNYQLGEGEDKVTE